MGGKGGEALGRVAGVFFFFCFFLFFFSYPFDHFIFLAVFVGGCVSVGGDQLSSVTGIEGERGYYLFFRYFVFYLIAVFCFF